MFPFDLCFVSKALSISINFKYFQMSTTHTHIFFFFTLGGFFVNLLTYVTYGAEGKKTVKEGSVVRIAFQREQRPLEAD